MCVCVCVCVCVLILALRLHCRSETKTLSKKNTHTQLTFLHDPEARCWHNSIQSTTLKFPSKNAVQHTRLWGFLKVLVDSLTVNTSDYQSPSPHHSTVWGRLWLIYEWSTIPLSWASLSSFSASLFLLASRSSLLS